jgi:hypothetical protein
MTMLSYVTLPFKSTPFIAKLQKEVEVDPLGSEVDASPYIMKPLANACVIAKS